jgi:hypothetical protein
MLSLGFPLKQWGLTTLLVEQLAIKLNVFSLLNHAYNPGSTKIRN